MHLGQFSESVKGAFQRFGSPVVSVSNMMYMKNENRKFNPGTEKDLKGVINVFEKRINVLKNALGIRR
tara:strand:- start:544 stop:747 length:204 start_codon:yes stop_codon:yes gene_type:complete